MISHEIIAKVQNEILDIFKREKLYTSEWIYIIGDLICISSKAQQLHMDKFKKDNKNE